MKRLLPILAFVCLSAGLLAGCTEKPTADQSGLAVGQTTRETLSPDDTNGETRPTDNDAGSAAGEETGRGGSSSIAADNGGSGATAAQTARTGAATGKTEKPNTAASSTAKPPKTITTTTKPPTTTTKPATTTTAAPPVNADPWKYPYDLTTIYADCKARVEGLGYRWNPSLNADNSSWVGNLSTYIFTKYPQRNNLKEAVLYDELLARLDTYSSIKSMYIYFEPDLVDIGNYYIYHFCEL